MSKHLAGGQHYDEGPEYAAPGIRIMAVVDFDPEQGECTIQSLSKHRACSHYLTAPTDEGRTHRSATRPRQRHRRR